jgi:hypothetical protein
VTMRMIDALRHPAVLDGTMWVAYVLPGGLTLNIQTIRIEDGEAYWCDNISDTSKCYKTAGFTYKRLHDEVVLVAPRKS